jgi:hypothetical protein
VQREREPVEGGRGSQLGEEREREPIGRGEGEEAGRERMSIESIYVRTWLSGFLVPLGLALFFLGGPLKEACLR